MDLSHHNLVRDLGFAKAAGIEAIFVKVTQGVGGHDQKYAQHAKTVVDAGMFLGAYHFGSGAASGKDQAAYHLDTLAADGGVPPALVLDVENNPGGITMSRAIAEDYVNTVHALHPSSTLMLYGGSLLREMHIPSDSVLLSCPLWLAEYGLKPHTIPPWGNWMLWQFTDKQGKVSGMPDSLDGYDLSEAFDGIATLKHIWNES